MNKYKTTKKDLILDDLTEQYCDFIAELFDINKRTSISDQEIEEFQSKIKDLVDDHGKNLGLFVVAKTKKGLIREGYGKKASRKARTVKSVLKNGIEITPDVSWVELRLVPGIIVKNNQTKKVEVKGVNMDLMKIEVYTGEVTRTKDGVAKVSTGKGESHVLGENPNEYMFNDFPSNILKMKEIENLV